VYTYDSSNRVTKIQKYPSGQANAEDTCQRVTYTYGGSTPSQYAQGRLGSAQYNLGSRQSQQGGWCGNGLNASVTEQYSYTPAGQVTVKQMTVGECQTDGYCEGASVSANYNYDQTGQVANMSYTGAAPFVYGSDGMARHVSLSQTGIAVNCDDGDSSTATEMLVQNGQFDFAGRLTSLQFAASRSQSVGFVYNAGCGDQNYYPQASDTYETESRTYDTNGQLSSLTWTAVSSASYSWGGGSLSYSYTGTNANGTARGNNGQAMQVVDTISGETIAYQYDGFGNLTSRTEGGVTTAIPVNAATNRLTNASYDANGNMFSGYGLTMTYDVSNRVVSATPASGGTEYYGYARDNKRVLRIKANGTQEWTLFGARGRSWEFMGGTFGNRPTIMGIRPGMVSG
jgi:hypothetical protein